MNTIEVPKYISKKCERLQSLCLNAHSLKLEIEKWCDKNGIDIYSSEWESEVLDNSINCEAILDIEGIEKLLNKKEME